MLAPQQWPEAARKRGREDEIEEVAHGGTVGFTEHRSKRLQALPLRTSPNAKPWSAPSFPPIAQGFGTVPVVSPNTITPQDSDSEDAFPSVRAEQIDGDMDMMDTSDFAPEPEDTAFPSDGDPSYLGPGPSQPDPIGSSINGRIPTPIHCSFAAQLRGNNWSGASGHVPQNQPIPNPLNPLALQNVVQGIANLESTPRSLDGASVAPGIVDEWTMVSNRRLPSPISEGDDTNDSPQMLLESSPRAGHGFSHEHPMLASLPPRASSAMELGSVREDAGAHGEIAGDGAMDVEPMTPPRKGHTRSRHTLNSWTQQMGMKKSFSIGYRADCEKCRMKVPGHFNHIIIS